MNLSLYITSYNQKDYLAEAIESALTQTRRPDEIVVVDDCSTDGSQELIRAYQDQYPDCVRGVLHEKNLGVSGARNTAIAAVKGRYVTYLDGDDRMLPNKLECEMDVIERQHADIVFSNYYEIDAAGERKGLWVEDPYAFDADMFGAVFAREFPKRDLYRCEVMETEVLRRAGPYKLELRMFEDFDMRIRSVGGLRGIYLDVPLSERRVHDQGLSSRPDMTRFKVLQGIYAENRHLLSGLNPDARSRIKKMHLAWLADFAYGAAFDVFREPKSAKRRLEMLKLLMFVCRHAPQRITLADIYALALPDAIYRRLVIV